MKGILRDIDQFSRVKISAHSIILKRKTVYRYHYMRFAENNQPQEHSWTVPSCDNDRFPSKTNEPLSDTFVLIPDLGLFSSEGYSQDDSPSDALINT